jgi:hypothetical protein
MTETSEVTTAGDSRGPGNKVLAKMLDRLMAVLVNGPSLNCRPHNSRQRVDFTQFKKLADITPEAALEKLLGDARKATIKARVPQPKRRTAREEGAAPKTGGPLPPGGPHGEEKQGANTAVPQDPQTDAPAEYREREQEQRPPIHRVAPREDTGFEAAAANGAAESAAERAWADQNALLNKLHTVAEDARTYEQDTGVHVLNVGFPLLSLPPGSAAGAAGSGATRRILAPIAFIPVSLTVKRGSPRAIELACRGEGVDLIIPNSALLSWIEQQTGKAPVFSESGEPDAASANGKAAELFSDEAGEDPWREIRELTRFVCAAMEIDLPAFFTERKAGEQGNGSDDIPKEGNTSAAAGDLALSPAPRADGPAEGPAILNTAILGLFPMANQGLLRDTQAMLANGTPQGPVRSFVRVGVSLDTAAESDPSRESEADEAAKPTERRRRDFATERLVADADPCQARAVRLARESPGLVVHGPPGTGKSQTITNIIGDHLASGQRVLLVCEKRTALDVVANRLRHMGLGGLIAIVHDPRRDQRELYRTLRQQLDDLSAAPIDPGAAGKLKKVDADLQKLHDELTAYHAALTGVEVESASPEPVSRRPARVAFHDLVGQWLDTMPAAEVGPRLDPPTADKVSALGLAGLEDRWHEIDEALRRAEAVEWAGNPWRDAATSDLSSFLARSADVQRAAVRACVESAHAGDTTLTTAMPAFSAEVDLTHQAEARVSLADKLESLLESAAPEMLARWSALPFTAAQDARAALTQAAPSMEAFRAGPLDADLLALASRGALPTPALIADQVALLQKYVDAYSGWSARIEAIVQKAPAAPMPVIARWVLAEASTAAAARSRLDAAAPLADGCSAAPLDAELLPVFRRQPFGLPQLLNWQSALEAYLQVASTWHAFFHFSRRGAATPVAQFFGLALSAATGGRLREFLAAARLRLEVREALDAALGRKSVPGLEDDQPLLGSFAEHRAAVTASTALDRRSVPGSARTAVEITDVNDLINRLVPAEHAAAAPILSAFGLPADFAGAGRLLAFLKGLAARLALEGLHARVLGRGLPAGATGPSLHLTDAELDESLRTHTRALDLILQVHTDPLLGGGSVTTAFNGALAEPSAGRALVDALRRSPARAAAILSLESTLAASRLFDPKWLGSLGLKLRGNEPAGPIFDELAARDDTLENVIRVLAANARLPDALQGATAALMRQSADSLVGMAILRHAALEGEIAARLAAAPILQEIDGRRIEANFDRYHKLVDRKQQLVRDTILARWVGRQKERLLSGTGSRLNALGAELRRRLTLRGEKAMRLRRVIEVGRRTAGGDPLLDLCPIWMVSPETVAQVFPLQQIFDSVVFDEASQCRLEEALPVLTRGSRVVIAGDPQQLPPSRFFESAVTVSEDEDPQTDQELFETQQGEVEDLLGAALGLDIRHCYLDVHYRSRSEELIAFSNEHFYHNRLQSIPRHPSSRPTFAPVTLYRADGIYDKRRNDAEADRVCQIVRELLSVKRPEDAPSIGIACFNLPQRDLIVERLDELASEDPAFGRKLEEARRRTGAGSFEGLFVKNLENVQGDERDHMIISTTYGPDKSGRFYRRFGPVGLAGGGRRLNVLVTRARDRVHLVTSIPAEAYRQLPPPGPGQTPGGGWLLFAYLRYAQGLEKEFEDASAARPKAAGPPGEKAQTRVGETRAPSVFAEAMARRLAARDIPSSVYWGNDGFCVDLLLHDPSGGKAPASAAVLCDAARYPAAEDPMEWDIFRSAVLEAQGWQLHRLWSPHVFRDPAGAVTAIARLVPGDPQTPRAAK